MADTDERDGSDVDGAHGVHAAPRDDGEMQEDPAPGAQGDNEEWVDQTETGGEATS